MNNQRGFTLISLLVLLFVGLLVGGFLMRVLPSYGEYARVVKAMKVVGESQGALTKDLYGLRQIFKSELTKRHITSVSAKDLRIANAPGGGRELKIKYETPVKLLRQLGVVVKFQRVVQIGPPK